MRKREGKIVLDKKNIIKEGITFHQIETNKFKTNLFALFLAIPLEKDEVTERALIPAVLRRGSKNYPTQELMSKTLEEMYGASFDCGIDKNGENQIIKFYIEGINEKFLPEKEKINEKCFDMLLEIVFQPKMEEGHFDPAYVESEKANLKNIISSKIDNKRKYALDRCIEEMYQDDAFGIYKYGYLEDVDPITTEDLTKAYQTLLQKAKIDIFVSGDQIGDLFEHIQNHPLIQNLEARKPEFRINQVIRKEKVSFSIKPKKVVEETMQVNQGNLIIGLDLGIEKEEEKEVANVYNAILGGGANSKLFQNVREKASLAYTAGSNYTKQKAVIFIRSGIEIQNYDQAVTIILKQIEDLKNGAFTEEDVENAKELLKASLRGIPEEQDSELTYYYGQELSEKETSLEEYLQKVELVTKQQVEDLAQRVCTNTIYFLRNEGKEAKA